MNNHGIATAADTVRIERMLPGPIERIWRYLTESELRKTWLAAGKMELRDAGRVEHRFDNDHLTEDDDASPPKYVGICDTPMHGRILACEPPRLLAYTWGEASGAPSQVRFELETRGNEVHLVVTHARLSTREAMISVASGWHAHLGILADRLAGRTPPGFWRTHTRLETEYGRLLPAS